MPTCVRRRHSAVLGAAFIIALFISAAAAAQDGAEGAPGGHRRHDLQQDGGRLTAEELVQSMPGIERYANPEFEQFSNLASGELTLAQWVTLAKRLNEIFRTEPDVAGLVVTSGTDTLEELAYFLDLTVRSDKPVVVVGSMRNPSTLGYEGAANLLEGFRVAAVAGRARQGHAGRAQRRDQRGARGHQDRRAAARTPSRRAATASSASSTPIASPSTARR